jgi:hypothetical protein
MRGRKIGLFYSITSVSEIEICCDKPRIKSISDAKQSEFFHKQTKRNANNIS